MCRRAADQSSCSSRPRGPRPPLDPRFHLTARNLREQRRRAHRSGASGTKSRIPGGVAATSASRPGKRRFRAF
eukprot:14095427-Alexandrium_andersonii.AAC.1